MTQEKKNLINYPIGTVGRDMVYNLFTNFILMFILYTRIGITHEQLAAITAIMVAARIFDALNDPVMGNIIEKTRTKYGKFKPWLAIGIVLTSIVVYLAFNTNLQGWDFIIFFGIIYFMYSITYTMHDISYWGMVPALSKDSDTRNKLTARATLFAGIGGTIASICIPLFTTGEFALGGSAKTAYGRIALIIAILSPLFILFTLFGTKENRDDMETEAPPLSFKKIANTIIKNDQLMIVALAFLLQEIGNGIVLGGAGSNYIYFEFGYEGGMYSTFTTVGMMATAVLMVFYPAISRKVSRKRLVYIMTVGAAVGYAIQLCGGVFMPSSTIKFWVLTIGFMLANFGQYGFYLVLMISIINTVEYNEYKYGTRDEAIITSMRPFLTKLSSSVTVIITSLTYMLFRVTDYTNKISEYETQAEQGLVTAAEKTSLISDIISGVMNYQKVGLLASMTILPFVMMLIASIIYIKKYDLTEEVYDDICVKIEKRKES